MYCVSRTTGIVCVREKYFNGYGYDRECTHSLPYYCAWNVRFINSNCNDDDSSAIKNLQGDIMKTKTKFCERFFNLSPKICIYDLDGTIIDSSHRATHDENGNIDLENWKANSTKEMIFQDDLLPMYWQLVADYKEGNIIVICTAREMGKWDLEYLHSMGIYYDYIISRPTGIETIDHVLKKSQLRKFWNLRQFKNLFKSFYDDNLNNLKSVKELGQCHTVNAKEWNARFSGKKS